MRKDKLKGLENKYWDGKSTLKDERTLKTDTNDAYFRKLKEAKAEQMDWSFDKFLHQASEKPETVIKLEHKRRIKSIWKYISIVAAFVLVGFIFFKNRGLDDIPNEEIVYTALDDTEKKNKETTGGAEDTDINREAKEAISLIQEIHPQQLPKRKTLSSSKVVEPKESLEKAYVVVNGQPVYDEEAEELALASLNMVIANLKEGKQAIEKIKYLKVEL